MAAVTKKCELHRQEVLKIAQRPFSFTFTWCTTNGSTPFILFQFALDMGRVELYTRESKSNVTTWCSQKCLLIFFISGTKNFSQWIFLTLGIFLDFYLYVCWNSNDAMGIEQWWLIYSVATIVPYLILLLCYLYCATWHLLHSHSQVCRLLVDYKKGCVRCDEYEIAFYQKIISVCGEIHFLSVCSILEPKCSRELTMLHK